MKNIVVAEIDGDVSDPFHARIILAYGIGKVNAVPAGELIPGNIDPLFHLRAGGGLQNYAGGFVENVLHEGRAVEFGFCKTA